LGGYEFFFWYAVYVASRGSFADVPIRFRPRLAGASKMHLREVLAASLTLREVGGRAREWQRMRLPDGGFPDYPTEYLDSLGELEGYNKWLFDSLAPFLRGKVLEVGAGTGTVTTRLARLGAVNSITAIEPDPARFATLDAAASRLTGGCSVTPVLGTIDATNEVFDTVLYCNSAEQKLGRLKGDLAFGDVNTIINQGFHEFIDGLQSNLNGVGGAIHETFFAVRNVGASQSQFQSN